MNNFVQSILSGLFFGFIIPLLSDQLFIRKIIILVAFAQSPMLLNFIVFNKALLFFIFVSYAWYNISLIIGLNIILNYNNYVKTTLISLAPQIILLIYFVSLFQGQPGIVS